MPLRIWTLAAIVGLGAMGVADAQPIDGDWFGTLNPAPGVTLHLAVHIHATADGRHEGAIDSLDQGARGIPLFEVSDTDGALAFQVPLIHGRYEGHWDAGVKAWVGQWYQGGRDFPLSLTAGEATGPGPGAAEPAMNRPQTPQPPFPYISEIITFDNVKAGVRLAGTLTLPPGEGPFPAVVLIAGSGPHGRDELIFGHRPFLVLADYLTRHGIAVLRYDKRGIGESTGDYAKATSLDFAADAEAAVAWLTAQPGIDARNIGLIGHSEGGLIAPMVAARDASVTFIILMAGAGVDGARVLAEQGRLMSKAMGVKAAEIAKSSALRETAIAIVRDEPDPATRAAKLKAAVKVYGAAHHLAKADLERLQAQYAPIDSDWFRVFFTYDPAPSLRTLRIPVLALIGEKDLQVPPDQNIPALRAALANDPRATVEELPGLNHLFQTAAMGSVSEYGALEETLAPSVLGRITDWILATTKAT